MNYSSLVAAIWKWLIPCSNELQGQLALIWPDASHTINTSGARAALILPGASSPLAAPGEFHVSWCSSLLGPLGAFVSSYQILGG